MKLQWDYSDEWAVEMVNMLRQGLVIITGLDGTKPLFELSEKGQARAAELIKKMQPPR